MSTDAAGSVPRLDVPGPESEGTGTGAISILVVDDEPGMRNFLKRSLARHYAVVELAESAEQAEELCQRCHFDLIISDIRLPGQSGVRWVQSLRDQGGSMQVIFITAHADLDTAIAALRAGAADFILKPFRVDQLMAAVDRCFQQQQMARENFVLRRQVEQWYAMDGLVGGCELMTSLCDVIKRIAPMPSTVLIEGESGTGKELAARAIHAWSGRNGPFVPINCAAFSAELLESELFGHVRGAFTGALQSREGLFTYAHGGTLFLDEIGEMPLAMQAKLLRVIQERRVRPLGSVQEEAVDVRLVSATHRNLSAMVQAGEFRQDLFYRLNVIELRTPSLRERREDLPGLAKALLQRICEDSGQKAPTLSRTAMDWILSHPLEGNVRELENLLQRALALSNGLTLEPDDFGDSPPSGVTTERTANDTTPGLVTGPDTLPQDHIPTDLQRYLDEQERDVLLKALKECGFNRTAAAARLGLNLRQMRYRIQRLGIAMPTDDDDGG